jgi:hypothetical protein
VQEGAIEAISGRRLEVEVMRRPVAARLGIAPSHVVVDVHGTPTHGPGAGVVREGVIGNAGTGRRARHAEVHGAPELLGHHLVGVVERRVAQHDHGVTASAVRAVAVDPRAQALADADGSVEHDVVLAVDTTLRARAHVGRDEPVTARFLRVPDLRDDRRGRDGHPVADPLVRVVRRRRVPGDERLVDAAGEGAEPLTEDHAGSLHPRTVAIRAVRRRW